MADVQELITDLKIRDNLSLGLANAKASVVGFGTAAETSAAKAEGAFGKLGSTVKTLATGFLAFSAANTAVDFLKDSVTAANEAELSNKRLAASLEANVGAWDGNTAAIERAVAAGQKLAFDDEDLQDSLAKLVGATHDVNRALQIQNTAMDLARFKGVSLAEATTALVTVEAGRFRGLAQLGIVLKEGATQTEALAAVQKVAAGQAEVFAGTTVGAMERAGVAVENLQEKIGGKLSPAITKLANAISDLADSGGLEKSFEPGLAPILSVTDGMRTFVDLIKVAGEPLKNLNDILQGTNKVETDLSAALVYNSLQIDHNHQAVVALKEAFSGLLPVLGQVTKEGLGGYTIAMLGAGRGTDDTSDDALRLANALTILKRDLDAIPRTVDIDINIREKRFAETALSRNVEERTADTSNDAQRFSSAQAAEAFRQDQLARKLAREAEAAAKEATAASEREAAAARSLAEAKARAQERYNRTLDQTKERATTLFDVLHQRHLQAISDTEKLAQKQHDTATQAITDALRLKLEANAAPVTAAEESQRRIEIARQRRGLNESLQTAVASGDPVAIRNAQEALQSFNAQQRIAALKLTQSTLDLAAQKEAAANQKTADDTLAAAKLAQAAAITAETNRDKKLRADFDKALDALKIKDKGASPAKLASDIGKLEKQFGITTDEKGFHHIADAIKTIKIPAPQVYLTAQFTSPPIFLNGRLIAAALASSQSLTATPGVRTGTLKPRP